MAMKTLEYNPLNAKQKIMARSSGHGLSEDMMIEIMSRLPVKSLLRFKCVCVSWCINIQSSHLISKHLNNYHNNCDNTLLLAQYCGSSVAIYPDEDSPCQPFDSPIEKSTLLGPCNGLFAVKHFNNYAIWNPGSKELKHLPASKNKPTVPPNADAMNDYWGFGLDPLSNCYKIVVIRPFYRPCQVEFQRIMVHTVGTNSWRYLEDFPDYYDLNVHGNHTSYTYLNGVYHWLADTEGIVILSFDMGQEVFQEIPLPDYPMKSRIYETCLVYNDLLALCTFHFTEKSLNLWVMKDGCWVKQLSFLGPLVGVQRPVACWKKDEIVVESDNHQLLVCNTGSQEIKDLGYQFEEYDLCRRIVIYKESLVSIDNENNYR